MNLTLVTWDIEGTLFSKEELKNQTAREVIRDNCLQLIREPPRLSLIEGVEEAMRAIKRKGGYQGIASAYAYQFGNNFLAASQAREYIDPRLIVLANKFAWEGHMLEGEDWDEVLAIYLKPKPTMLEIAKKRLEGILQREISAEECVHVGDQKQDEEAARNAGWGFYDIQNIARFQVELK